MTSSQMFYQTGELAIVRAHQQSAPFPAKGQVLGGGSNGIPPWLLDKVEFWVEVEFISVPPEVSSQI